MLLNILLVFLVTCFATAAIPTTMLAKEHKPHVADVVIENAAAEQEDDEDAFPDLDDNEADEELVSFDPAESRPVSFNFDELDENDKD